MAVSRAFGNTSSSKIGVIVEPSVEKVELCADTKFIILGSDGLWDGIPTDDVAKMASKFENARELAESLLKAGLEGLNASQLDDNVSVIVVPITNSCFTE